MLIENAWFFVSTLPIRPPEAFGITLRCLTNTALEVLHTYMCICVCVCVHICACMCIYTYICVCMCIYVCVCIYLYVCVYVYVYTDTYTYIKMYEELHLLHQLMPAI